MGRPGEGARKGRPSDPAFASADPGRPTPYAWAVPFGPLGTITYGRIVVVSSPATGWRASTVGGAFPHEGRPGTGWEEHQAALPITSGAAASMSKSNRQ